MRFIYLHGFASGPTSRKAQAFRNALAMGGIGLEIPQLDAGNFEHLTLTNQLAILDSIAGGETSVSLIGSSLGGYLAALYASSHPTISRVVLLAPAFDPSKIFEESTGPEKLAAWRSSGWLEVPYYPTGELRRIHYGFMEDAARYPSSPDFTQPALLFHGTADDVVPISRSRAFAAGRPNVQLIEMRAGHEMIEVLDQIVDRAAPFLLEK